MSIVFALIGVAALLFGLEVLPNEIAALGVLVLLVLLEPWTQMGPVEALSGFSNPATITVLSMFILSEGVRRTGVVRLIGKTIEEGMQEANLGLDILQIRRNDSTYIGPFSDQAIAAGDLLTIRADASTCEAFIESMRLDDLPLQQVSDDTFIDADHTLLECTVPPDSRLEGETLISSAFRNRYGATVLAIRRGDKVVRDRVEAETLHEGIRDRGYCTSLNTDTGIHPSTPSPSRTRRHCAW